MPLLYIYWLTLMFSQNYGSTATGFRQLDEAIPRTGITMSLPRMVVSCTEIIGLQAIHEFEHVHVEGYEQQYQIPATKAGGWEISSSRDTKKITESLKLNWSDATALGVRAWENVGASKRAWICCTSRTSVFRDGYSEICEVYVNGTDGPKLTGSLPTH